MIYLEDQASSTGGKVKDDLFKKLAEHLDDLPGGYPATESGVELRILRRLFSPEEAELALKTTLIPEEPSRIAKRAKLSEDEAADRLETMAKKGLIYRIKRKEGPLHYMAANFVIGIWEFHVNDLDLDLIRDFNEYVPELMDFETWQKSPQLRTVPVNASIDVKLETLPYEDAVEMVNKQEYFLEADCICRKEHRMVGEGCDKPEGCCLIMGRGVEYYEENGLGRVITKVEALDILKTADKAGLVLQPSYSKKISNICCCCGCCCQVLKNAKKHSEPAVLISSPFIAALDKDSCIGCGVCVDRCQMDALELGDEHVLLEEKRCIGCGLCVTTCPTASFTLERKPESSQTEIPDNQIKAWIERARLRGKMGPVRLMSLMLRARKRGYRPKNN
jgi:electron transport complex protein RnfB